MKYLLFFALFFANIFAIAQDAPRESGDSRKAGVARQEDAGIGQRPPRSVIDKKFLLLNGALAIAAGGDIWSTSDGLRNPHLHELNPLLGKRPGLPRLTLTIGAWDAGVVFASYKLKRRGSRWWWVPPAAMTVVHGIGVRNWQVRR